MRVNAAEPWATVSVRPRNVNVKFLHCRANAADDFGGPERLAEERHPAVFGLANGTKSVTGTCRLIGIEAAARELFFELGVAVLRQTTGTDTKGLAFEALEEFLELGLARVRKYQTTFGGFAVVNFVKLAEFANAVDVAEEVHNEEFIRSESGENGGPNGGCVFAADGFTAFGIEQLEANGFDIGAEVEGFDIEGERRQL